MHDEHSYTSGAHTHHAHDYSDGHHHGHTHQKGPNQWHDHDHDHHLPEEEVSLEDNPLWQRDNVILWSVGIDIGSAGTQILFSRVQLQRQAAELSSRYIVIDRETYYASPVSLTPYRSDTLIDDRALGALVDQAYHEAKVRPEDIDTGVVILTGKRCVVKTRHGLPAYCPRSAVTLCAQRRVIIWKPAWQPSVPVRHVLHLTVMSEY